MYVQLYITVGLKEIPKVNGEAGAYHLGPGLLQTLEGWGAHADMPSIVLLRMHACTVQAARGPGCCFQKRKNYDV